MSSQHTSINSASSSTHSLSFDEISKYFSLPLSDAATNLSVCPSVLKKICRDNGLDRWPYRKFLAGRSIEEIKKYASRERNKELAAISKVGSQSDSQAQIRGPSKSQVIASTQNFQQQGNKSITNGKPHVLSNVIVSKGVASLDEFKYGFPSDGLLTCKNKWWGSSSPNHEDGAETDEEDKHQSQDQEKVDDVGNSMACENQKQEESSMIGSQGSGALTAIRKRIVEEGRTALKLGVYQGHGLKKLGRREKGLLLRIFKTSLPEEWI